MTGDIPDENGDTNAEMRIQEGRTEKVVKVNYPSNSNKQKTAKTEAKLDRPEKKVEKVIQGEATQRKKGLGKKIRETFTGDDMQSVGNFIMFDVIVPTAKQLITDVVSQGIERAMYGESKRSTGTRTQGGRSYTNYSSYSNNRNPTGRAGESDGPKQMSYRGRAAHDFDEIVLDSRGDADQVLDEMMNLIRQYDVATVADLYDLVGYSSSFTDNKWGWTSLAGAGVTRARGSKYLLDLPRPESIE